MTGRRRNPGRAARPKPLQQLVDEESQPPNKRPRSEAWESNTDGGASSFISPEPTPEDAEFEADYRTTNSNSREMAPPGEPNTQETPGQDVDAKSNTPARRTPDLEPPTTIIGAPLGRNLSAIEAADALVDRWERIYEEALQNHGPDAVAGIAKQLAEAREDRAELDLLEDRDAIEMSFEETDTYRMEAVAERLEVLHWSLENTRNAQVKANIQAAIDCYEDGELGVSDKYALFYAGRFMELADTYEEFTEDRADRTARYAAMAGPGSLWYEPPLRVSGGSVMAPSVQVGAYKGTASRLSSHNLHRITMSFQGLRAKEGREVPSDTSPSRYNAPENAGAPYIKRTVDRFETDPSKPRLAFRMVLDSGASHPCLFAKDLEALGLDEETYPCVTASSVATANGITKNYVFELYVTICDTVSSESLVDPQNPVWADRRPELGGISRVVKFNMSGKNAPGPVARYTRSGRVKELYRGWERDREESCGRLSGMLPFQCCYVQGTPSRNELWFGEDRKDVLGAQRMPGQMRFEPGTRTTFETGHPRYVWETLGLGDGGNPTIVRMVHEVRGPDGDRVVRVQDCETEGSHGRSEVAVVDGTGWLEPYKIEPRKDAKKHRSKKGSADGEASGLNLGVKRKS